MPTKAQLKRQLKLDQLPDDSFMELLGQIEQRHNDAPPGSLSTVGAVEYTPEQIVEELNAALVARSVGDLIARARVEAGLSLSKVGSEVGVSRGRINQLERSENIEVSTLVRLAEALGYQVKISLEPRVAGRKPLTVNLDSHQKTHTSST